MAKKPTGFVIYKGPSLLDGTPIVAIAIVSSSNVKTGNMIQTHILVDNGKLPMENVNDLTDSAVCGDCKHRRGKGGACYVIPAQGPTVVFKTYLRGKYPESLDRAAQVASGRVVRMGTYGDPAAVPAYVWERLLSQSAGHTGYTHQHRSGKAEHVREWCMASADTEQERLEAQQNGWRTFRVRLAEDALTPGEFVCPASSEGGKRRLCEDCLACDGGTNPRKGSVAIISHGAVAKRYREFRMSVG